MEGREKLKRAFKNIINDLIIDFNAELKDRKDDNDPFDHKRELKSPRAIKKLETNIISFYQKGINRGKSNSFSGEWNSSD